MHLCQQQHAAANVVKVHTKALLQRATRTFVQVYKSLVRDSL